MIHRILLAGLVHETNTFVEEETGLLDFQRQVGDELFLSRGDSSPIGGFLDAAESFEWEVIPTVDYRAMAGGMVADEVIEAFWREFSERTSESLERGISAIFLVLHGAMVSQSYDDVEGEILSRLRAMKGAAEIPIFGVLDLHGNFTERMAENSNCLVGFRENPHTDARATGERAARLLKRCLETGEIPRTLWLHPPLVWPPTGTGTADEPMQTLEAMARRLEERHPEFWCANIWAGFSHADIAETGVSFSICAIGAMAAAKGALEDLANRALQWRKKGLPAEVDLDEAIGHFAGSRKPVILVEPSDNIGGGAPGDGTEILRALLARNIENAGIIINDPAAVATLNQYRIGTNALVCIGGRGSCLDRGPVDLDVTLVNRSDGIFYLEDTQSHIAALYGNRIDMGPSIVVRHNGITILLTSKKMPPCDLGQWRSLGINPEEFDLIVVKAAISHRQAYDKITGTSFTVDTPGPCGSNLRRLPFTKIRRPIFPLDD